MLNYTAGKVGLLKQPPDGTIQYYNVIRLCEAGYKIYFMLLSHKLIDSYLFASYLMLKWRLITVKNTGVIQEDLVCSQSQ